MKLHDGGHGQVFSKNERSQKNGRKQIKNVESGLLLFDCMIESRKTFISMYKSVAHLLHKVVLLFETHVTTNSDTPQKSNIDTKNCHV